MKIGIVDFELFMEQNLNPKYQKRSEHMAELCMNSKYIKNDFIYRQ